MFRTARLLAAALVALPLTTGIVDAQKKTQPVTRTPVTASFRCPLELDCLFSDGIQGDSLGTYTGTTVVEQGPYFDSNSHLYFPLKSGMGRFVSLDFSATTGTPSCTAKGNCRKNFSSAYTDDSNPPSITNPIDAAGNTIPNGFYAIAVGQSVRARYKFNFADPSGRALLWTVRFNSALYPGSTDVTVTRTADTWIVEASASDVAELVAINTSGRQAMTSEGFYSMPFRITVVR